MIRDGAKPGEVSPETRFLLLGIVVRTVRGAAERDYLKQIDASDRARVWALTALGRQVLRSADEVPAAAAAFAVLMAEA